MRSSLRLLVLCGFVLINSFLVYKAIWGESGLLAHQVMVEAQRAAEAECLALDAQNRALSREIRLLQTDAAYIEKMVRERLHYLHDNEILYLFGDDDEPAQAGRDMQQEGAHERKN
ncbi:MAG: septum formation initiator family protein [Desulfovibrionaceae bacterium]|nr:septum formation initiator family protein [Desulfovibrionaceae bacterium]